MFVEDGITFIQVNWMAGTCTHYEGVTPEDREFLRNLLIVDVFPACDYDYVLNKLPENYGIADESKDGVPTPAGDVVAYAASGALYCPEHLPADAGTRLNMSFGMGPNAILRTQGEWEEQPICSACRKPFNVPVIEVDYQLPLL